MDSAAIALVFAQDASIWGQLTNEVLPWSPLGVAILTGAFLLPTWAFHNSFGVKPSDVGVSRWVVLGLGVTAFLAIAFFLALAFGLAYLGNITGVLSIGQSRADSFWIALTGVALGWLWIVGWTAYKLKYGWPLFLINVAIVGLGLIAAVVVAMRLAPKEGLPVVIVRAGELPLAAIVATVVLCLVTLVSSSFRHGLVLSRRVREQGVERHFRVLPARAYFVRVVPLGPEMPANFDARHRHMYLGTGDRWLVVFDVTSKQTVRIPADKATVERSSAFG
jgi:hypothetical protein